MHHSTVDSACMYHIHTVTQLHASECLDCVFHHHHHHHCVCGDGTVIIPALTNVSCELLLKSHRWVLDLRLPYWQVSWKVNSLAIFQTSQNWPAQRGSKDWFIETSGTLIVGTKSLLKNENHMNRLQRKLTMSDNAGHTIACHVALLTLPLRWWLYSQ